MTSPLLTPRAGDKILFGAGAASVLPAKKNWLCFKNSYKLLEKRYIDENFTEYVFEPWQ